MGSKLLWPPKAPKGPHRPKPFWVWTYLGVGQLTHYVSPGPAKRPRATLIGLSGKGSLKLKKVLWAFCAFFGRMCNACNCLDVLYKSQGAMQGSQPWKGNIDTSSRYVTFIFFFLLASKKEKQLENEFPPVHGREKLLRASGSSSRRKTRAIVSGFGWQIPP